MVKNMIENAYPLAPMQEGILFETQYVADPELYFEQIRYCIQGYLHIEAFKRAWRTVIQRHAVLRTLFIWKEVEAPIQVVRQQMSLPWHEDDWQSDTPDLQGQRFEQFCVSERLRGFNLEKAPLMRLTLIRLAPESFYFLWSFHHILLDGWSIPIILDEVMVCYHAYIAESEPVLPSVRPYQDYIEWIQRQDDTQAELFWQERLRGFRQPTRLAIEATHTLPSQQHLIAHETRCLPPSLSAAVQQMAQQHNLTVNTLMQGVWAWLLSTYSGEHDVVFGATVSGRSIPLPGIEAMVGLFINALPIRVKIDSQSLIIPWLQAIQDQQIQNRQHESSPLVKIQKWSEIPKDQPLFRSLFVFENYPSSEDVHAGRDALRLLPLDSVEQTNYPLTLTIAPGEEITARLSYQGHLFDRQSIVRLLDHFQTGLEALVAQPVQRIGDLPLLTVAETEQQVVKWNQTATPFPADICIHELFEAQVAQHPQAIALRFEGEEWTYQQLNERANQVAHYLQEHGVKPDTLVGLCVERSLEMVMGMLGILKAGGAYVPLDPAYPPERVAFMLEDTHIALLLTQQHLLARLPHYDALTLCLDSDWPQIASGYATNNLRCKVTSKALAYVIYTSGSTGKPKGVMIPYEGLNNRLFWMQQTYHLTAHDRVLQKTPFSFDVSVWEFFWPLLAGATLVVARPEGHRDPDYLKTVILKERITVVHFVPSLLQFFVEGANQHYPDLKWVICSGEALGYDLQARFLAQFSNVELYNLYGPTEASIDVTFWRCERDSERQTVPIGRPIANTQIYILDQEMQPVPIGVPGELYIGGIGVARGYVQRPDITADKFVPDPFSKQEGARLYKTGDIARYCATGEIEYLGRGDQQIKMRGFRIELGEITSVLSQYSAVQDCTVMMREDAIGDKQLVAYVVLRSQHTDTIADLRNYLSAKLPIYMVPAFFVILPVLPLTSNGKLDYRALPAPNISHSGSDRPYVAPRTPIEIKLAQIWEQVLNTSTVSIHDNFFEIGGNSLYVVRMVIKAAKAGITLTMKQIFQHQTIANLAEILDRMPSIAEQQGFTGPVPALYLQQRFLATAKKLEVHTHAFNLRMHKPLVPEQLSRAVAALVEYHDGLRMVCTPPGSPDPFTILPALPIHKLYTRIDTSHLTDEELDEMILTQLDTVHLTPPELQTGPLFKVFHYDSGPKRSSQLIFMVHVLIADLESTQLIVNDLFDAYTQLMQSDTVVFPPKVTSVRQWIERLRTYAQSDEAARELRFWAEQAEHSVLPLPRDHYDKPNSAGTTVYVDRDLTVEETTLIVREFSSKMQVRADAIILAAVMLVIESWTRQRLVCFDLTTHGRVPLFDDADISRTVGAFGTTFPVVLDIGEARQIDAVARYIQSQLKQIPNQGIGWSVLHTFRHMSDADSLRAMAIPEIEFTYSSGYESNTEQAPCDIIGPWTVHVYDTEFPRPSTIQIFVPVAMEKLHVQWNFSSNVYDTATIERLVDAMMAILRNFAASLKTEYEQ